MPQKPLDDKDPSAFIGLRLPSRMVDRLKREAKAAGDSLSAHVRRILDGSRPAGRPKPASKAHAKEQESPLLSERTRARMLDRLVKKPAAKKAAKRSAKAKERAARKAKR